MKRPLSPRQAEIAARLVLGLTNKAIAKELGLSPSTIATHMGPLLRKLEVKNRRQAAYVLKRRP